MFKRFAVIGFSYFSLIVVLLSLLKVNVANAETNENLLQSEINKHFSHQSILHQKSLLIDFSELLLLFEDGEELELETDDECKHYKHKVTGKLYTWNFIDEKWI